MAPDWTVQQLGVGEPGHAANGKLESGDGSEAIRDRGSWAGVRTTKDGSLRGNRALSSCSSCQVARSPDGSLQTHGYCERLLVDSQVCWSRRLGD